MFEFSEKVLSQVKLALRETSNDFDDDIKADIESCALDLENSGILFYFFDASREDYTVDPLILRAVKWYCLSVYGIANPDMEKYDQAYRSLKATLATQKRYMREPSEPIRNAEMQEIRNLIRDLDLRVSDLEDLDSALSSTSTNALQNKVITENFDRVDLELIEQKEMIENVEEIARGKPNSESFETYRDMVNYLNLAPNNIFKTNDNILVATIGIPDFWVYSVEPTSVHYTFIDDSTLAEQISNGFVQIGYYKLSKSDGFNKQTLEKFALKSQVPVHNAQLKQNGAYSLIITVGIE